MQSAITNGRKSWPVGLPVFGIATVGEMERKSKTSTKIFTTIRMAVSVTPIGLCMLL